MFLNQFGKKVDKKTDSFDDRLLWPRVIITGLSSPSTPVFGLGSLPEIFICGICVLLAEELHFTCSVSCLSVYQSASAMARVPLAVGQVAHCQRAAFYNW